MEGRSQPLGDDLHPKTAPPVNAEILKKLNSGEHSKFGVDDQPPICKIVETKKGCIAFLEKELTKNTASVYAANRSLFKICHAILCRIAGICF